MLFFAKENLISFFENRTFLRGTNRTLSRGGDIAFRNYFHCTINWNILDKGINHVYIKQRRPRLNGKVERSHRTDEEEFYRMLNGVVIDDSSLFNEKLKEWEDFYNYHRPHSAVGGKTLYERFRERAELCV